MTKPIHSIKNKFFVSLVALIVYCQAADAQVTINGPVCVVPGVTYQYVLSGNWNELSWMRICIDGGVLASGGHCLPDSSVHSSIFVTWKDTTFHKLQLNSSSGSLALHLTATSDLTGGLVHDSDKVKFINPSLSSYTFRCQPAVGGACNPAYQYQWQRSENGVHWVNVEGANGHDLNFSGTVSVNTFFRRITNETNGGLTAYSDWALLAVPF